MSYLSESNTVMQPQNDIHSITMFTPTVITHTEPKDSEQPPPWACWVERRRNKVNDKSASFGNTSTLQAFEEEEMGSPHHSPLGFSSSRVRREPAKRRTSGRSQRRKGKEVSNITASHETPSNVPDTPQLDLLSYGYTWRRKGGRTVLYVSAGPNSCISHPDILTAMKECRTSSKGKPKRATITGHSAHILWQKVKAAKEANNIANGVAHSSCVSAVTRKRTTGGKRHRPSATVELVTQSTVNRPMIITPPLQHGNICASLYINPFSTHKIEGVNDNPSSEIILTSDVNDEKKEYSVSSASISDVSEETMSLIRELDANVKHRTVKCASKKTSYSDMHSGDSTLVWTSDSDDDICVGASDDDPLFPRPYCQIQKTPSSSSCVDASSTNITALTIDQSSPSQGSISICDKSLCVRSVYKEPSRASANNTSNLPSIGGKCGLNSAYQLYYQRPQVLVKSTAVVNMYDEVDDIDSIAQMDTHTGDIIGGYQFA